MCRGAPCDVESLARARWMRLPRADPACVGGLEARIRRVAQEGALNLDGVEIISRPSQPCRSRAQRRPGSGEGCGNDHEGQPAHRRAAARRAWRPGLHTARRMSHVFRFDVPMYSKPLLITDAAFNIQLHAGRQGRHHPERHRLRAHHGVEAPKVAILPAVETVNANIPSTLDVALCKMADRGQITGGRSMARWP